MEKEHSAGIVLFSEEKNKPRKYLLLDYEEGHWDFTKGHIENGESEIEAAKRECFEETGIDNLEIEPGFEEKIHYNYTGRNGKKCSKDVVFFLAKTDFYEVKISYEHKEHMWLSYEDALKRITFDNAREVLIKAEKFLYGMNVNDNEF